MSKERWGKPGEEDVQVREEVQETYTNSLLTTHGQAERHNLELSTMEELERVIKKPRRRTAPGPDKILTEIVQELDTSSQEQLLSLTHKCGMKDASEKASFKQEWC